MKILSLSVASFGKLSNVNLEFRDGINVISNANGFGKTTMANFIRAMLYGFTYSRAKGVTDASRFMTWGSTGKFGGSITVEHDGQTYRIERYFGATAKQQTLSVVNTKTNKEITLPREVGEYFLGLTAESYDRSAYYPQEAVELCSNDNFENRLANLVEDSSEDYDKVQKNIRDYRRNLQLERGQGGKIYELETEKRRLQRMIDDALVSERRSVAIDNRLGEIAREKEELTVLQAESKSKLDGLKKKLARTTLSDVEKSSLAKLNELEAKLSRMPQDIEKDKQRCDEIARNISQLRNDVKPRVYPNVPSLVVSAIIAVIGVILLCVLPKPTNYIVGIVAIVLGIAGVAVSFLIKGAKTLPSGERDGLVSEYYNIARKYFYTDDLDFNQAVKTFWKIYGDYQADKRELETLRSVTGRPSQDCDELERETEAEENRLERIREKYAELSREEGSLSQEKKSLVFDSITPREKLRETEEEQRKALRRYEIAGEVSELLAKAKDNLSSSYLPGLCGRCQELLRQITARDYEVAIDRDFNVKIRENGQTKSMSDFSRGTREITLLCFRVALSELLYNNELPFVIIDDAFVNFDEENFVRATDLLRRIAKRGQVIYFTCHKRMGNLLK
ncbi:MAG: AAA family ATPase [Corallococcus sp.]|nr:AAA family ATPase [Corallococcus sp.]